MIAFQAGNFPFLKASLTRTFFIEEEHVSTILHLHGHTDTAM